MAQPHYNYSATHVLPKQTFDPWNHIHTIPAQADLRVRVVPESSDPWSRLQPLISNQADPYQVKDVPGDGYCGLRALWFCFEDLCIREGYGIPTTMDEAANFMGSQEYNNMVAASFGVLGCDVNDLQHSAHHPNGWYDIKQLEVLALWLGQQLAPKKGIFVSFMTQNRIPPRPPLHELLNCQINWRKEYVVDHYLYIHHGLRGGQGHYMPIVARSFSSQAALQPRGWVSSDPTRDQARITRSNQKHSWALRGEFLLWALGRIDRNPKTKKREVNPHPQRVKDLFNRTCNRGSNQQNTVNHAVLAAKKALRKKGDEEIIIDESTNASTRLPAPGPPVHHDTILENLERIEAGNIYLRPDWDDRDPLGPFRGLKSKEKRFLQTCLDKNVGLELNEKNRWEPVDPEYIDDDDDDDDEGSDTRSNIVDLEDAENVPSSNEGDADRDNQDNGGNEPEGGERDQDEGDGANQTSFEAQERNDQRQNDDADQTTTEQHEGDNESAEIDETNQPAPSQHARDDEQQDDEADQTNTKKRKRDDEEEEENDEANQTTPNKRKRDDEGQTDEPDQTISKKRRRDDEDDEGEDEYRNIDPRLRNL